MPDAVVAGMEHSLCFSALRNRRMMNLELWMISRNIAIASEAKHVGTAYVRNWICPRGA
jgi:hypothetical protein